MSVESTYADLEIRIMERQEEGYPVEMTLDREQEFPRGVLSPDILPWVPGISPDEDGERLFERLFADDRLVAAWSEVRGQSPQRRIRLRIDAAAPELHAIPWELLRDPGDGGAAQDLAATATTPFSRYLAGKWQPGNPILKRPIKILVAVAAPQNLADYNLVAIEPEVEKRLLEEALEGLEVDLVQLPQPCTLPALEEELRKGIHVLHLVAHGIYSQETGEATLLLADGWNQVAPVREADFAAMLARQLADTGIRNEDRLRLVFLASCQTATRSPADAFRGFAPALVAAGVPAVLAMQDQVPVATARAFACTFYRQLLQHGLVDLAGNEARSALLTAELPGTAIPVLFMRLRNGRLFEHAAPGHELELEREPYEPETIYIPAGPFLMGSPPGEGVPKHETSQHEVALPAYRIGNYPVTVRQYAAFIKDKKDQPAPPGWFNREPVPEALDHPVTNVSWHDAWAYCVWLSQKTGRCYTLPSEAEWEKAASWDLGDREKRTYPWGNEWLDGRCNAGGSGTMVVDAHPDGASAYRVEDLLGNVQEWTRSRWGSQPAQPDFAYPYDPADGREVAAPENLPVQARLVHRGGSFKSTPADLRCSARGNSLASSKIAWRGFRVAMMIE